MRDDFFWKEQLDKIEKEIGFEELEMNLIEQRGIPFMFYSPFQSCFSCLNTYFKIDDNSLTAKMSEKSQELFDEDLRKREDKYLREKNE